MSPHPARRRSRERREGVALLIVMFIILMATATAYFAIHATAFEVRASGHVRQSMQTQYVAETGAVAALAWVDRQGPVALQRAIRKTNQTYGAPPMDKFNEPPIAQNKEGYRMSLPDLQSDLGVLPIDREALGGQRHAYEPMAYVDIYDKWVWTGNVAGERADGYSRLEYMRATYTSRGRTRVAAGDYQAPGPNERPYHEGAIDARAHGVSGPYGRQGGR